MGMQDHDKTFQIALVFFGGQFSGGKLSQGGISETESNVNSLCSLP